LRARQTVAPLSLLGRKAKGDECEVKINNQALVVSDAYRYRLGDYQKKDQNDKRRLQYRKHRNH
jgi:hypothetical protein